VTLTFEVTAHVRDAGHRPYNKFEVKFVGAPITKIWLIFGHGAKRPGDLDL